MFAYLLIVLVFLVNCLETAVYTITDDTASAYPCKNTKNFITTYNYTKTNNNQFYNLYMFVPVMRKGSYIRIMFSDSVNATLAPTGSAKLTYKGNSYISIDFTRDKRGAIGVSVAGLRSNHFPYVTSIVVNGEERCTDPVSGVFDELLNGSVPIITEEIISAPTCGRRQLIHTELITHSILTKPGDWPWHAAIYRKEKNTYDYKCGGTLLSKTVVLTAAHCLMIKGVNKVFPKKKVKVYLGKYNLYETDYDIQEKKVIQIIIHPNFNATNVNNDISLLRLNTEVEFNAIVQPACLWSPEVLNVLGNTIYGTVVGWGFDQNDQLSSQLRQAKIPMVDGLTCVLSNNIFFGKYLNQYKFCAGYTNGTSACNGDSGGGFVVFVRDKTTTNTKSHSGSWYVRGIVSVAVSRRDANICEPNSYVLFTDVAKYLEWISKHMNAEGVDVEDTEDITQEAIIETEIAETIINTPSVGPSAGPSAGPSCGIRKLTHVELMTNANPTSPGDWPWHAAVYKRLENFDLEYQCGGTLITKNVVVTGAGCIYNRSNVTKFFVVSLGRFKLNRVEDRVQTREVIEIVFHENLLISNLFNDIVLLRLKTDILYTPYIQPACIWDAEIGNTVKNIYNSTVIGSVAGWGFDETMKVTSELRSASFPMVSDVVCAKKSEIFKIYHPGKFCAGNANGTSPCKGDSGGGFMVFVPLNPEKPSSAGSWYLRGIVSVAAIDKDTSSCDTFGYVFYTDMDLYKDWIVQKLASWIF